jgi:transcriptional regulator with XRE-family HTH domain
MLFKEAVSQRILELCDKYNYTPNKLAELSAIPPSTLRALLSNNVDNPSSTIIFKICKTLKIDLKDFYDSKLFDMNTLEY